MMRNAANTILVFGATGQQGGAVASALKAEGWPVRALLRDTSSEKARMLAAAGIEVVPGSFEDRDSLERAMRGIYGVYSVQPSSGQGAAYNVSDADEIRYGCAIADIALAHGVKHFIYSSTNAAGPQPTQMGHFDSKSTIERYIAELGLPGTVLRPAAFMEILMLPGTGLEKGNLRFFMHSDQRMQFIAVEDIGRIAAAIFAQPDEWIGRTLEIASDEITGAELGNKLSHAAGRPIHYARFSQTLLDENTFLGGLASLVDDGRLAGNADLALLRRRFPGLKTFDDWLNGAGKTLLQNALENDGELRLR